MRRVFQGTPPLIRFLLSFLSHNSINRFSVPVTNTNTLAYYASATIMAEKVLSHLKQAMDLQGLVL